MKSPRVIRNLVPQKISRAWLELGPRFLPFADAASPELPLGQLLRLSLFQVSVGMSLVLLTGTLNRVMIVELGVSAWVVALMVALPLCFAPFRAFLGFRSDTHRSALGWRRVPYIWLGTMLQFGGLAIMPFALFILSGDTHGPVIYGEIGAALAFLLVGAGLHTTQTAGLALATDLAPEATRPRVVSLLYVMLLVGTVASALVYGLLLNPFNQVKLVGVVQGTGLLTLALNTTALWKQEARDPERTRDDLPRPEFRKAWRAMLARGKTKRFLVAVALGTSAFAMQDILLEPYGGAILGMSVSDTTRLTALLAGGTLMAFALAARALHHGMDAYRLAAWGAVIGVFAFAAVVFSGSMQSAGLFRFGTLLIGFGGGLFSVGCLSAAMAMDHGGLSGLALGAWGAVQASAAGLSTALGGVMRDLISGLAMHGSLGATLASPVTGYNAVYQLEILLLFVTLVVIGPLVRSQQRRELELQTQNSFGLAEFPG